METNSVNPTPTEAAATTIDAAEQALQQEQAVMRAVHALAEPNIKSISPRPDVVKATVKVTSTATKTVTTANPTVAGTSDTSSKVTTAAEKAAAAPQGIKIIGGR